MAMLYQNSILKKSNIVLKQNKYWSKTCAVSILDPFLIRKVIGNSVYLSTLNDGDSVEKVICAHLNNLSSVFKLGI